MAWQYLLAGITPAIKAGYLLANKPKPDDFRDKFGEETLNKMIANNQADIVNKTLLNQTTSAAKSLGSRLYQNTQHELDIAKEKGLLSSGQHAQALLSAGSDIQGKVGEQQQQALIQNTQFTAGLKANLDEQRMELGRIKDQAAKDYKAATKQWEAELVGVGMDFATVGANFAQAKFAEADTQQFMDDLMKEYPDWDNLTPQQQSAIWLKMQMHALGYKFPTGASATEPETLIPGVQDPKLLPSTKASPGITADVPFSMDSEALIDAAGTRQMESDALLQRSVMSATQQAADNTPITQQAADNTPMQSLPDSADPTQTTNPIGDGEGNSPALPSATYGDSNAALGVKQGSYTVGKGKQFSRNTKTGELVVKVNGSYYKVRVNGNTIKVKVGDTVTVGADGKVEVK